MRNCILFFILICITFVSYSQDWPVKRKVMESKIKGTAFMPVQALKHKTNRFAGSEGVYHVLEAQTEKLNQLLADKPEALLFTVPINKNESQVFELVKTDLGNVKFTKNGNQQIYDVNVPLCYSGVATGATGKNNAMLTLGSGYFSFTATYTNRTIYITKYSADNTNELKLYDSRSFHFDNTLPPCGTQKTPTPEALKAMESAHQNKINAPQDKCVYVFVECFDSLYYNFDSSYQQTVDYVYSLFNNVATGYLNEQINIKIATINIWTTADPYSGASREAALADLSAYYQNNFWGNICVGLDFGVNARSGLAGAIGMAKNISPNVCQVYSPSNHPFCYNDLNYNVNVQNFPTGTNVTQQQVYLVMHEIGHLLGSSHTHWCGWMISTNPNVFGALDNCAAVEGTCSAGPPPPASGGTIMSYCVSAGQVTNFNNGFGTLPGNAIRNFVSNTNCISNCPSCPANLTVGALVPGAQIYEVSNTLTLNGSSSAFTYATLDAGVKIVLASGFHAVSGSRMNIFINGCGGIR